MSSELLTWSFSWSPVTESNRRPSPYHACRFRPMASRGIGLPQVGGIAVSEYVVLCLALPGAVVTWFVTGSRTTSNRNTGIVGPAERLVGHRRADARQPPWDC